jgi:glutamyl-tRNA reductase
MVVSLREWLNGALEGELDRTLKGRLKHLGPEERDALAKMVEAAVNKALHAPTRQLRLLAQDPDARFELAGALTLLEDLFELGQRSLPPKAAPELPSAMESKIPKVVDVERDDESCHA